SLRRADRNRVAVGTGADRSRDRIIIWRGSGDVWFYCLPHGCSIIRVCSPARLLQPLFYPRDIVRERHAGIVIGRLANVADARAPASHVNWLLRGTHAGVQGDGSDPL